MADQKKTQAILKLMEYFITHKEISKDDEDILQEFQCSSKTLERYLKEIEDLYEHIITIKRGRKNVWQLISVSDVFKEFIQNSDDIASLFLDAREFDPEIFKELEKGTLSKVAKNDELVFLFKNYIMEEIRSDMSKQVFKNLKSAIKNYEYRDIIFKSGMSVEKSVKCIKLVFVDNNWYLAYVDSNDTLRLARVSFIESIKYASKNSFQKSSIKKHLNDLETKLQNAMTRFDKKPKTAMIKATPQVAKYFEKDMKKFLSSQKFQEKLDDGSVIFTVSYTQPLEILPFIQKWLPDLIILKPQELKEHYKEKLQKTLNNLS